MFLFPHHISAGNGAVNMKPSIVERYFSNAFSSLICVYVAFSYNKDIVQSYIQQVFPHVNKMASINCAVAATDFACIS
jgi:hypothetical protein